jgi:hypothetical protein
VSLDSSAAAQAGDRCAYDLICFVCREEVEKRFEGRLTKNMSGSLYEMVSRVMKALVNRKITVPGNFQG